MRRAREVTQGSGSGGSDVYKGRLYRGYAIGACGSLSPRRRLEIRVTLAIAERF